MRDTDLLGRPLEPAEREVLEIYERLGALASRPDAPPCVASNARFALAAIGQIVNDLGLAHDIEV